MGETHTMADLKLENKVTAIRSWGGGAAILACLLDTVASMVCWSSGEAKPGFLILLLSLPLIYVFVTAIRPDHLYTHSFFLIASASILTSCLWMIYCCLDDASFTKLWSWTSLALAASLMAFVFWLTGRIIGPGGYSKFADLRKRPLTTIGCFMVFFLQVTFFLTFALAFHDIKGEGLHSVIEAACVAQKGQSERVKSEIYRLWFGQGSGDSGLLRVLWDKIEVPAKECEEQELSSCQKSNCQALMNAAKDISSTGKVHVMIVGHADPVPIKDPQKPNQGASHKEDASWKTSRYSSNFELSSARALHVKALLDRILVDSNRRGLPRDVDIVTVAGSNEETAFLDKSGGKSPEACSEKPKGENRTDDQPRANEAPVERLGLSVEVAVIRDPSSAARCHLKMLDYLYFMTYTITTTGYGDIMPVSPEAKFITTLANLFELLFLVVFFNVLVSHGQGAP
jgi:hypothetical protein